LVCQEEQRSCEKVFSDLTSWIEKSHGESGTNLSQQQKCPKTLENMAQDTFFSKDSQEIQVCSMEMRDTDIDEAF
jgi:hypothetical protein